MTAATKGAALRAVDPPADEAPAKEPAGTVPIQYLAKFNWFFKKRGRRIVVRQGGESQDMGYVPPCTGVIVHRDEEGDVIRREYRLTLQGGRHVIVDEDHLDKGTWAKPCNLPKPTGKDATDAFAARIRWEADSAPELAARPYYADDGSLTLPDVGAQKLGFRKTAGKEDGARKAWDTITGYAMKDPKSVLVMGSYFVGPIVHYLGVVAHILNLYGDGQRGKSTMQKICAATMASTRGSKQKMLVSWNSSKQGIPQLLQNRGFLPIGLEENSSSGNTAKTGEQMLSAIVSGANRTLGGKDGNPLDSNGLWWSMALGSSNASLRRAGMTEDLASRLVEIRTPFLPNQKVRVEGRTKPVHLARFLLMLSHNFGGWPMNWAVEKDMYSVESLNKWANLHGEITYELMPDHEGGIAGTIAELFAAWGVGAYMLGEVLDVPDFGPTAKKAAAELLPGAITAATNANVPEGQKLWEALEHARTSPGKFPLAEDVPETLGNKMRRDEVHGYVRRTAGEQWVIGPMLRKLAAEAEVENLTAALAHLERLEVFRPGTDKPTMPLLPKSLRGDKRLPSKMYRFDITKAHEVFGAFDDDGAEGSERRSDGSEGSSATGTPDNASQGTTGASTACRACGEPMTKDLYGNGCHATCEPPADPSGGWPAGSVGELFAQEAVTHAVTGEEVTQPVTRSDQGVQASGQPPARPVTVPAQAAPADAPSLSAAGSSAVSMDTPADAPRPEQMAASVHGQSMQAPAASAPREPGATPGVAAPTREAVATRPEQGVSPSTPEGVSRVATPAAARPERKRTYAKTELSAALQERFDRFAQAHNGDTAAMLDSLAKGGKGNPVIRDAMELLDLSRASGRYDHGAYFPKNTAAHEIFTKSGRSKANQIWEGRQHWTNENASAGASVETLDVNASFLTAMKTALPLAFLSEDTSGEFDKSESGAYLITPPAWQHDHLPNPLGNRREAGDLWVMRPTLELLTAQAAKGNCNAPVIHRAFTAHASASYLEEFRRVLATFRMDCIRDADDSGTPGDEYPGLVYVKQMYSKFVSTVGDSGANHEIRRPDWHHTIRAQAFANLWRKAEKAHANDLTVYQVKGIDELHIIGDWREVFPEGRDLSQMKAKDSYEIEGDN